MGLWIVIGVCVALVGVVMLVNYSRAATRLPSPSPDAGFVAWEDEDDDRPETGYLLPVAGESFDNPDGSSRQAILRRAKPNQPVTLRRELDNPHSDTAVAVHVPGGQIGYISSRHSEWISDWLDTDVAVAVRLHSLHGGTRDKPSLGAVIHIERLDREC